MYLEIQLKFLKNLLYIMKFIYIPCKCKSYNEILFTFHVSVNPIMKFIYTPCMYKYLIIFIYIRVSEKINLNCVNLFHAM
jgi:hypothetical protein